MIRSDQIPDEVVEAGAIALHARWVIMQVQDGGDPLDYERWEGLDQQEKAGWRSEARAAIAAALSVWPGAWAVPMYSDPKTMLHLPLPQKDSIEDVGDA